MPFFPPQNDPEESHDREDRKTEENTKDTRRLETSHYGIEAVLPCLFLYICALCTGLPLRHSRNDDKTLQVDDKPRNPFGRYGVKPSRASGKRSPLHTGHTLRLGRAIEAAEFSGRVRRRRSVLIWTKTGIIFPSRHYAERIEQHICRTAGNNQKHS